MTEDDVFAAVQVELNRARSLHAPMVTAHHGYGVILEELDELWDEIKLKQPDTTRMREEAIQVAVTAIRFVLDICERSDQND